MMPPGEYDSPEWVLVLPELNQVTSASGFRAGRCPLVWRPTKHGHRLPIRPSLGSGATMRGADEGVEGLRAQGGLFARAAALSVPACFNQ
jgi:hypothetical protein